MAQGSPEVKGFDTVLVLDYGAQYGQLIARRVRECRVYSELIPHDASIAGILVCGCQQIAARDLCKPRRRLPALRAQAEGGRYQRADHLRPHTGRPGISEAERAAPGDQR